MQEIDVKYICSSIIEPFKELVVVLKKEMESNAFSTKDYDKMKIEYNYLSTLIQRMENEAAE